MSTAWTSSVWGQGRRAISVTRKLQQGEDECFVCRDDVPASVGLRPCGHKLCAVCVENMRAKNIFKADKGVKCPFCRQFVEGYELLDEESEYADALRSLLEEANRAAVVAATARGQALASSVTHAELVAAGSGKDWHPMPELRPDWACPSCSEANAFWRTGCSTCGAGGPHPKPLKPANPMSNEAELVACLTVASHALFAKAITEAGLTLTHTGLAESDPKRVAAALKNRSADRLLRFVAVLADPDHFQACCLHPTGTFSVQNLAEAAVRLREAMAAVPSAATALASFRRTFKGLDPAGLLLYVALPMMLELSKHNLATYVMQKLIVAAAPHEIVDVGEALAPYVITLLNSNNGRFTPLRTLEVLVDRCRDGAEWRSAAAIRAAGPIARLVLDTPEEIMHLATQHFGVVCLTCVLSVGIPQHDCLLLGSRLTSLVPNLLGQFWSHGAKPGLDMVTALLQLEAPAWGPAWAAEHFRDLACCAAGHVLGSLAHLATSEEEKAQAIVHALLRRMVEEQELGWVEACVQELIGAGDLLIGHEAALDLLAEVLSSGLFCDDDVHLHLTELAMLVGNVAYDVANKADLLRVSQPPLPPPRYHNPSILQPLQKTWLRGGWRPPAAPEPPPPGHPGPWVNPNPNAAAAAADILLADPTEGSPEQAWGLAEEPGAPAPTSLPAATVPAPVPESRKDKAGPYPHLATDKFQKPLQQPRPLVTLGQGGHAPTPRAHPDPPTTYTLSAPSHPNPSSNPSYVPGYVAAWDAPIPQPHQPSTSGHANGNSAAHSWGVAASAESIAQRPVQAVREAGRVPAHPTPSAYPASAGLQGGRGPMQTVSQNALPWPPTQPLHPTPPLSHPQPAAVGALTHLFPQLLVGQAAAGQGQALPPPAAGLPQLVAMPVRPLQVALTPSYQRCCPKLHGRYRTW